MRMKFLESMLRVIIYAPEGAQYYYLRQSWGICLPGLYLRASTLYFVCRSIAKPIPKDHLTKVRAHQLRRRLPSSKHPQGISSMFRGPSWVDHSWRPALLFPLPKKRSKPRRARGKINSSGASSRLAPQTSAAVSLSYSQA
jgi:hypothetical protein